MKPHLKTVVLTLAGVMVVASFAHAVMHEYQSYQLRAAFKLMGANMAEASRQSFEHQKEVDQARGKREREAVEASNRRQLDAQRMVAAKEEELRRAEDAALARAVAWAAANPPAPAERAPRARRVARPRDVAENEAPESDPLEDVRDRAPTARGRPSLEALDPWNH
jgi:hypothetical protein